MADQRSQVERNVRVPFKKLILLNGGVWGVQSVDISVGGMFVHTNRAFKPGTVLKIAIPIALDTLNVSARVQHCKAGIGMGLKFIGLDEKIAAKIAAFINKSPLATQKETVEKRRVIFVDIAGENVTMHVSELVRNGYTVLEARSVERAIEDIRNTQHIVALLMVIGDESSKCFDLIKVIKATPGIREIPVLVISDNNRPSLMRKVSEHQADMFLPRMNTSPKKLRELIDSLESIEVMKPKDRRGWRTVRVRVDIPVNINNQAGGMAIDLSDSGMYVYTRHTVSSDSIVNVSFELGPHLIDLSAKVAHSQQGIGFGVRFIDMPDRVRTALQEYVKKAEAAGKAVPSKGPIPQ